MNKTLNSFQNRIGILIVALPLLLLLTACDEDDGNTTDPVSTPGIVINEVMARNTSTYADEESEFDDWIELYNADAVDIDIGGYTVTDNLDDPVKHTISIDHPDQTTIPAGGYLLLWADDDTDQGPLHLRFNLSGDGEDFGLYDPDGHLIDAVTFGAQNDDISYGRYPDASDHWVFLVPSVLAANETQASNMPPIIRDTQRSPAVPLAGETVEVSCEVTDEYSVSVVTLVYRVEGGSYVETEMDSDGTLLYSATIPGQAADQSVEYYVRAVDNDDAVSTDPAFAPTSTYSYLVRDVPAIGPLYINELLAANSSVNVDEDGDYDDWIEIHNAGDSAVDIGGMYITDDLDEPTFYQIPLGHEEETTIPAGGFLLLWADKELNEGPLHVNIKLSADGEAVGLFASDNDGNELLDAINFPAQETDISYGRLTDGGPTLQALPIPTPGASNEQ